mmetsp:Transcript_12221/g.10521  ORF Transcript_12221/g.10521 Transcript_12221/m.10521 type:complete len:110 (+) Transcript_12221:185-514(+)
MSGVLFTIMIEVYGIWKHLEKRANKSNDGKITVHLAKIEFAKLFGGEIGVNYHEVTEKKKKKRYYENNRSKPFGDFTVMEPKSDEKVTQTPKKESEDQTQPPAEEPTSD